MPRQMVPKLVAYTLVFFLVFFLTAVIFSQVILKSEAVTVPDLTGKTIAQARTELDKKDIHLAQRGSEFNESIPRGQIVRQDPAPNSRIRVTKVVTVVTSAGSLNVTVPDLHSNSLENALTLLKDAGLTRGKMTQIHTPRYPAGRVIAQAPAAGEVVERNAPVGLLLSQGGREERYIMPDLIGRRADRTAASLNDMDFKVADIHYVYYPGQSSGIIVNQFPPGGYAIQKRGLITLEVSR